MLVFFIVGVCITVIMNICLVRKIKNRTYRICISSMNIIVLAAFIILGTAVNIVRRNLGSFLNQQISTIETKANEIYPGMLDVQMDTSKIKEMLENSFSLENSGTFEDIVIQILRSSVNDFSTTALKTLTALERTDNKLSVKEVLVSLKEICMNKITPFYRIADIVLVAVFSLYVICSLCMSLYLSSAKASENKSIVFGEESARISAGMKTDE